MEKQYKLENLMDTLSLCHDLLVKSGADKNHLLRLGFIVSQISYWYKAELKLESKNKRKILFLPIDRTKK